MFRASPTGFKAFTIVWMGQLVSLLGSAMTWFAFTIWAWQKTGQATALAMVSFFAFLPTVLFTPLAGVLVDRWDRKWVMLLSDLATALGTLAALCLYASGQLQLWHIYLIGVLAGFFTAFQYPAYAAAVPLLVPKQHLARAEGMLGASQALSGMLAPVFAAALLGRIGMAGIMTIDLLTFLAAFGTLLWVAIPRPSASAAGLSSRGSLRAEALFGFRYIRSRPSLRGLVVLFAAGNVFLAIGATLMAPLILSRAQSSSSVLASVQSVGALGGLAGSALLALWGGPKRRIHAVLLGGAAACLLGVLGLGLARAWMLWAAASFCFSFFEPFVEGGNLAIWQSKVESDVQGRVLSARYWLVQIPYMLGMGLSGPLAEYGLGPLLPASPSAGIALLMALAGLGGAAVFLSGYLSRHVRLAESLLPDPLAAPAPSIPLASQSSG